jgi:hypothetical protein
MRPVFACHLDIPSYMNASSTVRSMRTSSFALPDPHARFISPPGLHHHVTPLQASNITCILLQAPTITCPLPPTYAPPSTTYINLSLPLPIYFLQLFFATRLRSSVVSVLFSVTTKTRRTRLCYPFIFLQPPAFWFPGCAWAGNAGLCRWYLHCFWPTRLRFSLIVLPWGGASKKRVGYGEGKGRRDV